jgi:hypothetical protein
MRIKISSQTICLLFWMSYSLFPIFALKMLLHSFYKKNYPGGRLSHNNNFFLSLSIVLFGVGNSAEY